jgi:hypothetical protein
LLPASLEFIARDECAHYRMATSIIMVYPQAVDSVASNAPGSRRSNQDETSPFPLEFEIIAGRKRVVHREGRSQDETSPFPLEFEVVARKSRESQEETSPFLLDFKVILNGEPAFVRTARPPRSPRRIEHRRSSSKALPRLKWHGVDASRELREYAARIAAGEALPPYRGPILANGELPRLRPERPSRAAPPHAMAAAPVDSPNDDSKASVKFLLALLVMSALVAAAALLGDDAQLRAVGQSIIRWSTGRDDSFQLHPIDPASSASVGSPASQR